MFFFFTDPTTTEIYTLSLHDALPILALLLVESADAAQDQRILGQAELPPGGARRLRRHRAELLEGSPVPDEPHAVGGRSEEHTSELQSRLHLVCRLLLEKKKKKEQ